MSINGAELRGDGEGGGQCIGISSAFLAQRAASPWEAGLVSVVGRGACFRENGSGLEFLGGEGGRREDQRVGGFGIACC